MKRRAIDPAEIAVMGHALHSVAAEMGAALRRTAFSPNIKERRDYSSAVFSADGDLIAMGDDMPVHLGSMPMSVAAALEAMRFTPGDVALLNDPYRGGTHLPDLTMVAPVFVKGHAGPAFYVANRAHHADVGGMHPGSMGPCREIAQEGIRIPPVKLMHAGKMDAQVLAILLANVRTPAEREGDLTAQLGACRIGMARMQELVERFGFARLGRGVRAMLEGSERVMRGVLSGLPAGAWRAEDFLDDDGVRPGRIGIRVAVRNDPANKRAIVDFTGTDAQVAGNIPIHCVGSQKAKRCAVNSRARPGSVGRPVIEVAIAIRIRTRCDVVWIAAAQEEFAGEFSFQRQFHLAHQISETGCLPVYSRRFALLAVARLRIGRPRCILTAETSIGADTCHVNIERGSAETLGIVLL